MPTAARPFTVLDAVLAATPARRAEPEGLAGFLRERSPWRALGWWLKSSGYSDDRPPSRQEVVARLTRDIARLDTILSAQVNAIIHHATFQRLEASWRGLQYLVCEVADEENVKVRVFHATWKDIARDQERAIEFDQSQLFKKVYNEEFGSPGGEPYGLLLCDYEVRHRSSQDHPTDDISTLAGVAAVAAAAFAPAIIGADPAIFDLEGFTDLERPLDLSQTFTHPDYLKWHALRQKEDARFVGIVLPRVLMRAPYPDLPAKNGAFRFREVVGQPNRSTYLWGSAVYAFGAIVTQAFADAGWFADLRGVRPGFRGQGLVTGLPSPEFPTDSDGVAPNGSVDAHITESREKELADYGFIPLCHCQGTDLAAFFSNMSLQQPATFDRTGATANARLSAMIQYVLCVSRFAHYLKVMARDRVGAFTEPSECEDYLRKWLLGYTTAAGGSDETERARYPLRDGRVQVSETPGKPGAYQCVMHLSPHVQLDQAVATVRLATELTQARA